MDFGFGCGLAASDLQLSVLFTALNTLLSITVNTAIGVFPK